MICLVIYGAVNQGIFEDFNNRFPRLLHDWRPPSIQITHNALGANTLVNFCPLLMIANKKSVLPTKACPAKEKAIIIYPHSSTQHIFGGIFNNDMPLFRFLWFLINYMPLHKWCDIVLTFLLFNLIRWNNKWMENKENWISW